MTTIPPPSPYVRLSHEPEPLLEGLTRMIFSNNQLSTADVLLQVKSLVYASFRDAIAERRIPLAPDQLDLLYVKCWIGDAERGLVSICICSSDRETHRLLEDNGCFLDRLRLPAG